MKIIISLCLLLLTASTPFLGQTENRQEKRDRIESLKVAFMTERLELSVEESQEFWPLYNEYYGSIKAIKKEQKNLLHSNSDGKTNSANSALISEEDARILVESTSELRIQEIKLGEEFILNCFDIIGYKRAIKIQKLNNEFRKTVLARAKSNN